MLRSVLTSLFRRAGRASLAPARALHAAGDSAAAIAAARAIASREPDHAEAQYCAGAWLAQAGHWAASMPFLERACSLAPHDADARLALGNALRAAGDAAGAERRYREVIAVLPGSAAGHYNLGLLLKPTAAEAAAGCFARAGALDPGSEEIRTEEVLALVACGRHAAAVAAGEDAVRRLPRSGRVRNALGYALQVAHQPAAALACYDDAVALGGADHELWNNRGIVLQELGRTDEALSAYDRALELAPQFRTARFHRALARLARRDYGTAWDDYELRLEPAVAPPPVAGARAWQGEPLAGRSLVVLGEQGLGDELMFAGCVPDIVRQAARCTLVCEPRLQALFARSFPGARVVATEAGKPLAVAADYQVRAGSLPRHCRREPAAFPVHGGYLRAAPERVACWRERLAALGPGLKVGLSWRGGTPGTRAPLRSLAPTALAPLYGLPGVRCVSLQYGDHDDLEAAAAPVTVWPEALADYDETAALTSALDLVVSVCTAVVHLGGALGRPVWVLAPLGAEWRYGTTGDRMDWYPSVRVFRQRQFGDWNPVIAEVTRALQRALADR